LTLLQTIVMTFAIAAAAVVLLIILTKFMPSARREPHNDVVGFVYAVIGVIYAVVLAMVVIGTWETLDTARANTYTESNALIDVYWYGKSLDTPAGTQIDRLAQQYTDTVINQEWPLLAGQGSSGQAWNEANALRAAVTAQAPATPAQQARYEQALTATATLSDARRERINEAGDGIPSPLWVTLILGGAVTVAFALGFGMKSLWAHAAVVFCATLVVASLLILINELNFPFSGAVRVEPDAFQLALQQMQGLG
jgi:multisubunit Na+/H+ antiporter MnhB subunit